eukprot:m.326812 g.326812  ORF g.326812 m.326812 type:complete len:147 (-) comp16487_c0_seq2:831-1271(-)
MEGGWWSQPKPNVLVVYLREDVPTETILAHMTRIFADHGIPEPERQDNGTYVVNMKSIKFSATISAGRHPVSGNLLAIEVNAGRTLGDKVLIGMTIVAIAALVLVVAVVAGEAIANHHGGHSGGGGGGGGGGGHHHHHHHTTALPA